MNFGLIRESLPEVLQGLGITVAMWLPASVLAAGLGLVVAILRHYGGPALDRSLQTLFGVLRGTPFLVQLFLLYYGGPFIGLDFDAAEAGLIGLSLYGAAYFAEIIRGGFAAVPRGHIEAASCVGLTRGQILRRILIPEVALLILPASVNMLIVLMKETAILSIITVPELTATVTGIASLHFAYAEGAFILALAYWGLTEVTGRVGRLCEVRLQRFRLA